MRDFAYFNALLRLDVATGLLYWRKPERKRNIFHPIGHVSRQGYRRVLVNGKKYLAHRLVWLLYTRQWPSGEIDHINNLKDDNRPINLRDVTAAENTAAYWRSRNAKLG